MGLGFRVYFSSYFNRINIQVISLEFRTWNRSVSTNPSIKLSNHKFHTLRVCLGLLEIQFLPIILNPVQTKFQKVRRMQTKVTDEKHYECRLLLIKSPMPKTWSIIDTKAIMWCREWTQVLASTLTNSMLNLRFERCHKIHDRCCQ